MRGSSFPSMNKTTCKYFNSNEPYFVLWCSYFCLDASYCGAYFVVGVFVFVVVCRKMREFVPIDIYKTSQQRMIDQGLTPGVANRIWTHKALWLICTHKDDIKKVSLNGLNWNYVCYTSEFSLAFSVSSR